MATLSTMEQQQEQTPRPHLRRAIYVHVSDLTSVYNIDNLKLEEELSRVKAERDACVENEEEKENIRIARQRRPSSNSQDGDNSSVTGNFNSTTKKLQPPRSGFNLCVLVGNVSVVVDKLRVDRSRVRLAEVEVGDETGIVSLRARDDQIDVLKEVSDRGGAVVLRNATLELYRGRHIRLAVTKWGKISCYPDNVASTPPLPSKMNHDRNFSQIDLSLVASEMVIPSSPSEAAYGQHGLSRSDEKGDAKGRGVVGLKTSERQQQSQSNQQQSQHQQLHSQQQQRKGSRDRRQHRQKSSGMHSQVPVSFHDPGVANPLGFHPFPSNYGKGLVPSQYTYASAATGRTQQESQNQASARQLLLQQFELQQRQIQQMQMYQEHEHQRRMQEHQMQPSPVLIPGIVHSGSFERKGEYHVSGGSEQQQQHPSLVPQLLIPMTVPSQQKQNDNMQRDIAPLQTTDARAPSSGSSQMNNAWERGPGFQSQRPESPLSPGRMNPQATAFAPTYNQQETQQQPHPQRQPPQTMHTAPYTYVQYDPSQGAPYGGTTSPHQPMYAQGVVYVPAIHAVAGSTNPTNTTQTPQQEQQQSGASTPSNKDSNK